MIGNAKYYCPECKQPIYHGKGHAGSKRHRICNLSFLRRQHKIAVTKNKKFAQPILKAETMKQWLNEVES